MALDSSIVPSAGWAELLAEIGRGTTLVVGAAGTGKSSLARYLTGQLDRALPRVALVDCDPGRPAIGVPGCLALALTAPWRAPAALWFVGATSPEETPLPAVVGAARLVERARAEDAAAVILDTPSGADEPAGRELIYHLAQASGAGRVVAIERGGELTPLLAVLAREGREVHRLKPSPAAHPRTPDEAAEKRGGRLRAHLYDATTRLFGAARLVEGWTRTDGNGTGGNRAESQGSNGLGSNGPGGSNGNGAQESSAGNGNGHASIEPPPPGTVVGLLDGAGFCLGLGRLEEIGDDRVAVATRVASREVASVRVGGFRLAEDGTPL